MTMIIFGMTLTGLQYRDQKFDDILEDPQSKHKNFLANKSVKHDCSMGENADSFHIQGSCRPRALMATS